MLKKPVLLSITIIFHNLPLNARSIHRSPDDTIATITVNYENDPKVHTLTDARLREFPLFHTYNHQYFMSKLIPDQVPFKYEPGKTANGHEVKKLINKLLNEIRSGKTEFSDFKSLKQRDFNFFQKTGLLVLKFKDDKKYPFIFKIFLETPESFIAPDDKSFQVRGVFYLGGTFRHIMGYTRLRNIDLIENQVSNNPQWKSKVDIVKKWFWVPEDVKYLEINGYNLGGKIHQKTKIPSIYGLLCEYVKEDEKKNTNISREYLKLCSYLDFTLDPLPSNFKAGKNGKIILIDTEHFATLIGIDKKFREYDKYSSYWPKIMGKYLKDRFVTTKYQRRAKQANNKHLFPLFEYD